METIEELNKIIAELQDENKFLKEKLEKHRLAHNKSINKYYQKNKDTLKPKIKAYQRERYLAQGYTECPCGGKFLTAFTNKHNQSKKHLKYLELTHEEQ